MSMTRWAGTGLFLGGCFLVLNAPTCAALAFALVLYWAMAERRRR